jgi:hypothetical protein
MIVPWALLGFPLAWLLMSRGWLETKTDVEGTHDLRGFEVIVTGANTGIGKRTAAAYARLVSHHTVMAASSHNHSAPAQLPTCQEGAQRLEVSEATDVISSVICHLTGCVAAPIGTGQGARVLVTVRSRAKADATLRDLRAELLALPGWRFPHAAHGAHSLSAVLMELSDLNSVNEAAAEIRWASLSLGAEEGSGKCLVPRSDVPPVTRRQGFARK